MIGADVICFSHLRWGFVYQRPNHLMVRCARSQRVFFVEEPCFDAADAHLKVDVVHPNVTRIVPHLPRHSPAAEDTVASLLEWFCRGHEIVRACHWYYTPMMLGVSQRMPRELVVYDCMDELAMFLHAPPELHARERQLFHEADIVFTGGHSLYEAKRRLHHNVHAVPSSVDPVHFERARGALAEPADQVGIRRPRIGYSGVIDERMNLKLIAEVARRRPHWQLIMLGPVVKIAESALPRRDNIHYLGLKKYDELPNYLAGWDAAIMPFARNEATRFISPTKTPEYLAAGKPVVSTPITDVVEPYGRLGLVRIAADPDSFVAELEAALLTGSPAPDTERDAFLSTMSWDATWERMQELINQTRYDHAGRRSIAPLAEVADV
jgi:glycosyltransferase involved in cell wall biosynthesis